MSEQSLIHLRGITKCYGQATALQNLNLEVKRGEFLTLLGASGCGKTTTLRLISGFETPTQGEIYLDGKCMNSVPAHKRRVNTVFQNYALFPHMSVGDNVAYGLRFDGVSRDERRQRAVQMLDRVGLADKFDRHPDALSGGQKQRVALARALIKEPEVLLLDEPLSALDARLRKQLQVELKRVQRDTGITFVYVTHDQEEALVMSDRIAIMDNGQIQQLGPPQDIFERPANLFVAQFVGESNALDGHIVSVDSKGCWVELSEGRRLLAQAGQPCVPGEPVTTIIRPEHLRIVSDESSHGSHNTLKVSLEEVIYLGTHRKLMLRCPTGEALELQDHHERLPSGLLQKVGAQLTLEIPSHALYIFRRGACR